MSKDKALDALKEAILLERKGMAFYRMVAGQSEDDAVKEFFSLMAEEEQGHWNILAKHYKTLVENNNFLKQDYDTKGKPGATAAKILNRDLRKKISAAGFEAAAISAAMMLEKNSIDLYSKRAKESSDKDERALYKWLLEWEREHLVFLADIDNALREEVWYDNKFWPFL